MKQNNLRKTHKQMILILVVVEEGLVRTEVICTSGKCFVLILIVVEDGLVQFRSRVSQ